MGSRQIPQLPQVVFHAQKQLGNLEIQVFRSTSSVYCDSEASEVCRKLFWQVKLLACHFATPLNNATPLTRLQSYLARLLLVMILSSMIPHQWL